MSVRSKPGYLSAKFDALPYQLEAFDAVKDLEYAAIFHEQGLGKTKIAIDIVLYWLASEHVDCSLIVTKKGLVENWRRELARHTHVTPLVLSERSFRSLSSVIGNVLVYVTHYELLKSDAELIDLLVRSKKVGIVLDEAQKIKNPSAALSQIYHRFSNSFVRRMILTGTPIANRPYDIWSQIFFLDQGDSLGCDFAQFKSELDIPKVKDSDNLTEREEEAISNFESQLTNVFSKIDGFTVRETKSSAGIKLPNKEFEVIVADWEPEQRIIYEQVRDELRIEVLRDSTLQEDVSESLLKRLLRLVQISSNPQIVDQRYNHVPGKANTLDRLIAKIVDSGEKVIVWTAFTENVDWIASRYSHYGSVKVHGKMDYHARNRSISLFLDDPEVFVFVATPGAAKEGLTLTVANHVVFFDRSFSLDDYLQAQDRIHRISQKRTCYVYNVVLPDSIDEWVDSLLVSKGAAASLAQRDIDVEEYQSLVTYDQHQLLRNVLNIDEEPN